MLWCCLPTAAESILVLAPIHCTLDKARVLLDDANSYEVVRGELLVSPAPPSVTAPTRSNANQNS